MAESGLHPALGAIRSLSIERRRRITHRAVPALALGAFAFGLLLGANAPSDEEQIANRFGSAWGRADYTAMYRSLSPKARRMTSFSRFERSYRAAAEAATAVRVVVGRARAGGPGALLPVVIATRIFGNIRGALAVPVADGGVAWTPELVFPGLARGERLTRATHAPPRAAILARDGRPIVSGQGSARAAAPGPAAGIAGRLGPSPSPAERAALIAAGFPPGTPAGASGLERELEPRLRGIPGGTLRAGTRTLATSTARAADRLRSTIDLRIQAAAELALAGRVGGIVALDARNAEIRALAGIALGTQPPGSTFKIITATAALEAQLVRPTTSFPFRTKAMIDGVSLSNANGESCGGTFAQSFATSCNSVFAPLGVRIGAARLVSAAERFGFNESVPIPGAAVSTLPRAAEVGSPLAVGSTSIGQGKVLASPLEMALVADTIARGGIRREPTLVAAMPDATARRVTDPRTAALVERLMLGVVQHGTGTAAALRGVKVAGKTGTAELGNTVPGQAPSERGGNAPPNTDAWFAAYAPVPRPSLAVAVMLVKAGAGGDVAAPAARTVLEAGLKAR